jgi:hypothetical protein
MKWCNCGHSESEHVMGQMCSHLFLSASEEVGHYFCPCDKFCESE